MKAQSGQNSLRDRREASIYPRTNEYSSEYSSPFPEAMIIVSVAGLLCRTDIYI